MSELRIWQSPKEVWEMRLVKDSNLVFSMCKAPSWFHRLMQRIVLGIVWKRIDHGR